MAIGHPLQQPSNVTHNGFNVWYMNEFVISLYKTAKSQSIFVKTCIRLHDQNYVLQLFGLYIFIIDTQW